MVDVSLSEAFVQGIIDGKFDTELLDIAAAVSVRKKAMAVASSMNIKVGDKVETNDMISPKYLRHLTGTVVSKEGTTKAVVQIDSGQFTGRYTRRLEVPTEVLVRVEEENVA